jgi:hypothetical protein
VTTARDFNAEVEGYLGLCESLAVTLAKPGTRGRNGVEFDDLVQEGLIFVWQSLQRGVLPASKLVKGRMVDYQRWLGRRGPTPYSTQLPIEAF